MCSAALANLLERFGLADPSLPDEPGVPPFTGGLIGFFGYDLAPRLERLPRRSARDSRLPDIRFGLYDTAVTVDHATGSVDLWAFDFLGEGDGPRDRRLAAWRAARLKHPRAPRRPRRSFARAGAATRSRTRRICTLCGRVLEYISAGDVFQVNLSQRFVARGRPDPLDLFLRLRSRSPAPFSRLPSLGRPGRPERQSRVVLPDAWRHPGDPADQGDPAPRGARSTRTRGWPRSSPPAPRTAPS